MSKNIIKKTKKPVIKKEAKLKNVAPYDVCDRFCERCSHKSKCRAFQDTHGSQIMSAIEGISSKDIKSVFSDIETSFKRIKAMMKGMIREGGEDAQYAERDKELDGQYRAVELNIKKHILYKQSQEFSKYAGKFLKRFFLFSQTDNPFLLPALNKEINDISFYFPMISDKIYLALLGLLDPYEKKNESLRREINCSACLALNASLVCEKAVANIMNEASELYIESMQFVTILNDIRSGILQTFPEAEDFQEEIIFNTSL